MITSYTSLHLQPGAVWDPNPPPLRRRPPPGRAPVRPGPGPTSCRPMGRPPAPPHGTEMAGTPARLAGTVRRSAWYISRGSSRFSPMRKATVGVVGAARTRSAQRLLEVLPDQPAHLERLDVVFVVVSGRKDERAQHDPPLDFEPEALAAGLLKHRDDVGSVFRPVSVADPVITAQVGAGLRRSDDVVGGLCVADVWQRHLLHPSPEAFQHSHGGVDSLPDVRRDALAEELLGKADHQPLHAAVDLGGEIGCVAGKTRRSRGSWPAMADKSRAASRTSLVMGPIWSKDEANPTNPNRETSP